MDTVFKPSTSDVLGLIILGFLIYLIRRNHFIQKQKSECFLFVTIISIIIIVLEILSDYLNHYASQNSIAWAFAVNICGFSLMFVLPVILGMLYSKKIHQYKLICLFPACIGAIMCVSSIWTGWIFEIDSNGIYQRGSLFGANILITAYGYLVLLYAHMEIAKEYDGSEKTYLWLLYLIVLGVTIIQVLDPQMEIMWGGIAVTELLYYVFQGNLQLKIDAVTRVRNRICFEHNLMNTFQSNSLFLINFDVNNLKYINDTYGHIAGDEFLRESAKIIKKAYKNCGKVYRIGGDEFAVIAINCTEEKVKQAREQMLILLSQRKHYQHLNSYIANAYSKYNHAIHNSIYECLKEADLKMYEDKKNSKDQVDSEKSERLNKN